MLETTSTNEFVFRIGARRQIEVESQNFEHQTVAHWPSLLVVINNDHTVQTMMIQIDPSAFQLPDTVAKIFGSNINKGLKKWHLVCLIEPTFDEADFWELVRRHRNSITYADFELIKPNMANISHTLDAQLKQLVDETNSAVTNVRLHAPPGNALTIEEDDSITRGLVDYASKGGGNIKLKFKGLRHVHNTKTNTKEFQIDEAEIEGDNGDAILKALKSLFK